MPTLAIMKSESNLLRLTSGDTAVVIAPDRGAIVTSFCVADRELMYFDQTTFNEPLKNIRGGVPILFPTPGKLDNDRWSYDSKQGTLKQHGFARNLSWRVDARTDSSATLVLRSSDLTLQSYPWNFTARLRYALAPSALSIEFEVENESATPLPFAFGLHPYFAVSNKAAARIPTRSTRAFDNVSKTIVPFDGFDLTRDEVDLHLIDHGSSQAELHLGDGTAIAIEASAEFTRWVVWTVAGKDYVCLEPWTALGNALNSGEALIVLEPGEARTLRTCIAFRKV